MASDYVLASGFLLEFLLWLPSMTGCDREMEAQYTFPFQVSVSRGLYLKWAHRAVILLEVSKENSMSLVVFLFCFVLTQSSALS